MTETGQPAELVHGILAAAMTIVAVFAAGEHRLLTEGGSRS
jgi:hypothetical protein